jgi:N-acetylmuramoyl-L-alanine amidase
VIFTYPKKALLFALLFVFLWPLTPAWAGEKGIVTGSVVNVRKGPGLNFAVVAKAQAGQEVETLEKSGDWLKVRLNSGGTEGWVHKSLVQINTGQKTVKVTGSTVNIRKGPGAGYAKVGQVRSGTLLVVSDEKNGWYLVQAPGGVKGWIAGWYTVVEPVAVQSGTIPEQNGRQYITVTTEVLNVRSGPDTEYPLVTKIGMNEKHPVTAAQGGWYKIAVGDVEGWVCGEYVRLSSEASPENTPLDTVIVTGSTVNIRQQASIEAAVVAQVKKGDRLAVTGRDGEWLEIRLSNGTKGWIVNWLTSPDSPGAASRGTILESEALIAPISEGRNFKIIDSSGRPILLLEGWTSSQYQIKTAKDKNTITLELEGATERNYEGKITRLGISGIKIYSQADKAIIELTFSYAPTQTVSFDDTAKVTRIQIGVVQTAGLSGKIIVVDPGHSSVQPGGWLDPGAIGIKTGLKEKDVNLDIAFKLKRLLEQAGARVIMTHTGQTELSLAERAWLANNSRADIFVSIHANFSDNKKIKISGHSTYYYAPLNNSELSDQRYSRQKLATLVQRELVKAGGRNDLGVLQENFAVLRETRVPSILVETAFLSDSEEETLLGTDSFRQKLATGIFNGIKAYFE